MAGDFCGEYNGVERRKHCEMVVSVNTQFKDFMESTKAYRQRQEEAISDLSATVLAMREEIRDMKKPYKILVWLITIISGAFLLNAVEWIFSFIKDKIHFIR
jgi:hypothetical protein